MNQVLRQSNCDPDDDENQDIWDFEEDEDTGEEEEYDDDEYDY